MVEKGRELLDTYISDAEAQGTEAVLSKADLRNLLADDADGVLEAVEYTRWSSMMHELDKADDIQGILMDRLSRVQRALACEIYIHLQNSDSEMN